MKNIHNKRKRCKIHSFSRHPLACPAQGCGFYTAYGTTIRKPKIVAVEVAFAYFVDHQQQGTHKLVGQ